MAYDKGNYGASDSYAITQTTMNKVYGWMALALAISSMAAYFIATTPAMLQLIFGSSMTMLGLIIGEVALVIWLSARIHKMSYPMAATLFLLYSVLNGATLSVVLLAYAASTVYTAFFATAATFGVMSLIGLTTNKDLSNLGGFLLMALVGIIIASLVNLFVHSSMLDSIIIYGGLFVFVGLTAYDTQKIKQMLAYSDGSNEQASKIALMGALSLYLDFVNLFLYIIRLLGRRD